MSDDTNTLTLTDFLLARIAEDEVNAKVRADARMALALAERQAFGESYMVVGDAFDPTRVLGDREAKRRIMELHTPLDGEDCDPSCGDVPTPCATLRTLAAVYATHPDYRDEWRP